MDRIYLAGNLIIEFLLGVFTPGTSLYWGTVGITCVALFLIESAEGRRWAFPRERITVSDAVVVLALVFTPVLNCLVTIATLFALITEFLEGLLSLIMPPLGKIGNLPIYDPKWLQRKRKPPTDS